MLAEDATNDDCRTWAKHNQSFFHGADAYTIGDIGRHYTWVKIFSPRIATLHQVLIACNSRARSGYEHNDDIVTSETLDG